MADGSTIEWLARPGTKPASWTPIRARNRATGKIGWHCEHATSGCVNCYAESMNRRLGTGLVFKPGHRTDLDIFLDEKTLLQPLRWKQPRTIFVCSMTDLFAGFVADDWIDRVFAVMALSPQHTFIVLTKRPERMREYLTFARSRLGSEVLGTYEHIYNTMDALARGGLTQPHPYRFTYPYGMPWPLPNVWLGTSIEDQATADARVPLLLDTPAAIRFVSAEPLLGPVSLTNIRRTRCLASEGSCCGDRPYVDALRGIQACRRAGAYGFPNRDQIPRGLDWVIVGGESGRNARPMHPDWARALRDQCQAAQEPRSGKAATGKAATPAYFFKQWGEWLPLPEDGDWGRDWFILDRNGVDDIPDERVPMYDEGEVAIRRVGKKAAGALLDGRTWRQWPEAAT